MTNFDFLLSEPDFLAFVSVAVSAERILQVALSAQCAHWAPPPQGEARGTVPKVRSWLPLWGSWHGVSRD